MLVFLDYVSTFWNIPVDTGRKLNVHKTFRRRPGRLLNVLCTFNLRPVSTGIGLYYIFCFLWIGTKNRKFFITRKLHSFWKISGTVLLSGYFLKCAGLLKELFPRFFELEVEHCSLTQNPLRRLVLFHWYCNFNPIPCNICGMYDIWAKM